MDSGGDDFFSDSDDPLENVSADSDHYYDEADHPEDSDDEAGDHPDPEDSDDEAGDHQQQNYTVLSEADIRRCQEEDIGQVSTTLSIARALSSRLLSYHNWDAGRVLDEWFADEEKVRKAVGLLEVPVEMTHDATGELICAICFETQTPDTMRAAAACGHRYCDSCWRAYIGTSIRDGPGCLMLRCPHPPCGAAVCQDMVDTLAGDHDKETYRRYLLRSYVEGSKRMRWCPSPGCEYAVDFEKGGGGYDVCCKCSYGFCWNCAEEAHRPVKCETVKEWILKNSSEAENSNWILVNSKPCPKCQRPIQKNQGCMHMTCSPPCGFHFCWLCLGEWKQHESFYGCNRFEDEKRTGVHDEADTTRRKARAALKRYTHYSNRWAGNHRSMQKALDDLRGLRDGRLSELRHKQGESDGQMQFIIEAWLQIVECRRVLKWAYAFGYFLDGDKDEATKRPLFEQLQGDAEAGLERLHHCAEKELQAHFDSATPTPREEFDMFRGKLAGLTRVTRNYFENLVRALETGLEECQR